MSIVEAMLSEDVLTAALGYLECGLSVLPVTGKQPSVSWYRLQTEKPTSGLIHWWHMKEKLHGVGIIAGRVSGNLVVMDCDGEQAVQTYEETFPHLLNTLTVRSGSGQGKHYYYFTQSYTPTTRTKGFELRSDGCYVVAPPSKHPVSCLAYRVERYTDPRHLRDLSDVREWIAAKVRQNQQLQQVKQVKQSGEVVHATLYAATALSRECDNVRGAVQHERNNVLFRAALKMGNLIQLGQISESEVEDALFRAAAHLSTDDGEGATLRTIKSGINIGRNPRGGIRR